MDSLLASIKVLDSSSISELSLFKISISEAITTKEIYISEMVSEGEYNYYYAGVVPPIVDMAEFKSSVKLLKSYLKSVLSVEDLAKFKNKSEIVTLDGYFREVQLEATFMACIF